MGQKYCRRISDSLLAYRLKTPLAKSRALLYAVKVGSHLHGRVDKLKIGLRQVFYVEHCSETVLSEQCSTLLTYVHRDFPVIPLFLVGLTRQFPTFCTNYFTTGDLTSQIFKTDYLKYH
jgi:hypothetical protein